MVRHPAAPGEVQSGTGVDTIATHSLSLLREDSHAWVGVMAVLPSPRPTMDDLVAVLLIPTAYIRSIWHGVLTVFPASQADLALQDH